MNSAKISTASFYGGSGDGYKFEVYNWDASFRQGLGAVYVIAQRYKLQNGKYTILPVYIAETADISTLMGFFHPKQSCFEKHAANCKCIYLSRDPERREWIVEDLLEEYDTSCN